MKTDKCAFIVSWCAFLCSSFSAGFLLIFGVSALAATRTVTSLADSGAGSLRDTIAASGSGDTINFGVTGTITLTSASLSVNHNLTIQGPGSGSLTITRQGGPTDFRIFYFDNGTWTLSDLTISNGNDTVTGGGIYNGNGNLTLNNCVVTGNTGSQRGGGIGNDATMTMNNVFVLNNFSGSSGGGGVYNSGTLTIHNSTFSNNRSTSDGGGLNNTNTFTVDTSTFDNNTGAGGGGISTDTGTIQNCTFFNNHGIGNALRLGTGTTTIQSCTFSSNISEQGGSIYFLSTASIARISNTILDSRGSPDGTFFLHNGGTVTSLGYNLATDRGGDFLTATGDQINKDPKLDPYGLQYNGGFTDTIALTGGSPAIDAGKSFGLTSDQRGLARTFDYAAVANATGGDGTDIGAYETSGDPPANGLVVNTTADHNDGVCGTGDCTLREAIARANTFFGLQNPPHITFAPGVSGTISLQGGVLDLTKNVEIDGPGPRILALSGGGAHRIFNGDSGTITIQGLTIRDGNYVSGQNHGETEQGGGIFNSATLTLNNCALVNNTVTGATNVNNAGVGGTGQGGAIYTNHSLTLNGCTFSGNSAIGAAGAPFSSGGTLGAGGTGGAGQGGAVFNGGFGGVTIQNCTFSGNAATGGNGGAGSGTILASGGNANGGAVFNQWALVLDSCTVSGNTGSGGFGASGGLRHGARGSGSGGLSVQGSGITQVGNSIVAGNTGNTAPDAEGTFQSDGDNLIGIADQSTGFNGGDQVGTAASPLNPHLGPLGNNGGPTDTMLLLYGSTALDAGFTRLLVDQRGLTRPIDTVFANVGFGAGEDIGAVEMNLNGGGPDTDMDGMSDDFEKFYGFNPLNAADGAEDSDGDGLTNAQECAFGTNPQDASSVFRISGVVYANSDFTVFFGPTVPKAYRLERKNSLAPGLAWTSIPGLPDYSFSSVGTGRIDDQSATASRYFYRVRPLP